LIRSHSIIYCGSIFGGNFTTGHIVTIREKNIFGMHFSVGTLFDIQGYVKTLTLVYNFDRGMPWAESGYENWLRIQKSD
jgi:hypothetical protein